MTEKRAKYVLWMMIAGGVLIILAGASLVLHNQPGEIVNTPTPATADQVQRVTVEQAEAALKAGTAVFVDVRDSYSYEISHIPGALNLTITDLADHLGELNPSSWIITYCT